MSALSRELSKYEVERINQAEISASVSNDLRRITNRTEYLIMEDESYNMREFNKRYDDLIQDVLTWKQYSRLRKMPGSSYFDQLRNIRKVSKSNKVYDMTVKLEYFLSSILEFQRQAEMYSWFHK